jgi:hypothetical protein
LFQAAILQQTAEYIYQLEQEKTSLLSQNCQLKRVINQQEGQHETTSSKKRKIDTGIGHWPIFVLAPVMYLLMQVMKSVSYEKFKR